MSIFRFQDGQIREGVINCRQEQKIVSDVLELKAVIFTRIWVEVGMPANEQMKKDAFRLFLKSEG